MMAQKKKQRQIIGLNSALLGNLTTPSDSVPSSGQHPSKKSDLTKAASSKAKAADPKPQGKGTDAGQRKNNKNTPKDSKKRKVRETKITEEENTEKKQDRHQSKLLVEVERLSWLDIPRHKCDLFEHLTLTINNSTTVVSMVCQKKSNPPLLTR
ncbi:hypothetical protein OWV82_021889 [Melia azedarach]|uniref:Uncharacterized protein n=1 Tax=Melia azedarach TaxID=155640 RepID=A0ACC1X196_MELAZ|nr:hypothetical protein OWV82_021889 [Melia azedarach]